MEEGTGDFFDLYNSIINMEGQEEIAKRDVIKSYYNFGEWALKIYDLFSEIGEHMIQRIKSFSVSTIAKLSQDD
ncbi:hypothetical protein RclHR1_09920009, partial [Rhizophagus clarus]